MNGFPLHPCTEAMRTSSKDYPGQERAGFWCEGLSAPPLGRGTILERGSLGPSSERDDGGDSFRRKKCHKGPAMTVEVFQNTSRGPHVLETMNGF